MHLRPMRPSTTAAVLVVFELPGLRLLGEGANDGEGVMEKGQKWILNHGGATAITSWGKFWLSTVLDAGTGSGILAKWSAQAGARKVYAVEATKMADHARELVQANNLQDVVEVMRWMGYFLLRESMFDSVIVARDRWLKPTGVMYPSHARMWLAPIRSGLSDHKMSEYEGCMDDWHGFVKETRTYYGVDMSVLTKPFSEEQKKYYLKNSLWNNLHPNQVVGTPAVLKEIDCLTVTVEDILKVEACISSTITKEDTRLCGFGGWEGKRILLSVGLSLLQLPVFLLHPPVRVSEQDEDGLQVGYLVSSNNQTSSNWFKKDVGLSSELLVKAFKKIGARKKKRKVTFELGVDDAGKKKRKPLDQSQNHHSP
ncbi:protein arginine N-methyltransferase PRMT10 [Artemisia annua]|uniref:Protein arginine N-methyltransferase PRMT10 n=1 Tax=Artemisia annua TaxID=35608 RepID=A0A2U1MNW5_ARTAN|nr:protein arginine N-methyltransferase PRMT10 [Artemisia annua]